MPIHPSDDDHASEPRVAVIADAPNARAAAALAAGLDGAIVQTRAFRVARVDRTPAGCRFVRRLVAALDRARPDVVIAAGMSAGIACGLVWRRVGARHYVWFQPEVERLDPDPRALSLAFEATPRFFAGSPFAAGFLIDTLGAPGSRVRIAEPDVDLWPRTLAERPALPPAADPGALLCALCGVDPLGRGRRREIDRAVGPLIDAMVRDGIDSCQVYGASDVGRAIVRLARRRRILVSALIDRDRTRWGGFVDGVEVRSPVQALAGPGVFAVGALEDAAPIAASIAALFPAGAQPRIYRIP